MRKKFTNNSEYSVKTEKMVYGGAALAKISGLPIFINGAAPFETLNIKITKINKSFLSGEIQSIEQCSPFRVSPVCSLSKICGSCDWQYIAYSEQLRQKQLIIQDSFKKIAGIDVSINSIIPSPKVTEYRCKVQLPFSQTKVSKRLLSGYYKKNSHELINIKHCYMQPDIINDINEFLKIQAAELRISAYDEKIGSGLLRHIIYRISSDLSQILIILVINSNYIDDKLVKLSNVLIDKYPQIVGVCANFNTQKTNVITGQKTEIIKGQDFYVETIADKKYKISVTGFFQVNPYCAELIFKRVKDIITERVKNPVILDAYSGVSSFGIFLSDIAKEVISIEEVESASKDAIENIKLNNIKNLKVINGDASKEFEKLIKQGVKFDVSVTDPPRKGCSAQSIEFLCELTSKYIIYISCNPSTLARDVKILMNKGFKLEYIQGADMFPNTYHIETIAVLVNGKHN